MLLYDILTAEYKINIKYISLLTLPTLPELRGPTPFFNQFWS